MRHLGALLTVLAITLSGCGGVGDPHVSTGRGDDLPSGSAETVAETAEIYAAVVRRLVTNDHTFGRAPSPFQRVYVVDGAVADASDPLMATHLDVARPFDVELKERMLRAVADLAAVNFVSDPATVIVDETTCPRVKGEGVLISLGPILQGERRVTVASGLFFACLGGQWLTYVLDRVEDEWRIVGTRGPVAIS